MACRHARHRSGRAGERAPGDGWPLRRLQGLGWLRARLPDRPGAWIRRQAMHSSKPASGRQRRVLPPSRRGRVGAISRLGIRRGRRAGPRRGRGRRQDDRRGESSNGDVDASAARGDRSQGQGSSALMAESSPSALPLTGVTVVALEQAVAGPFCSRQLADMGARVIKIERPGTGDFDRAYDGTLNGLSAYFAWLNRGKESVVLDLKTVGGRDALERLVQRGGGFILNPAPGGVGGFGAGLWGV